MYEHTIKAPHSAILAVSRKALKELSYTLSDEYPATYPVVQFGRKESPIENHLVVVGYADTKTNPPTEYSTILIVLVDTKPKAFQRIVDRIERKLTHSA